MIRNPPPIEPDICGNFFNDGLWYDLVGILRVERVYGRIEDVHLDLHWIELNGVRCSDDWRDELEGTEAFKKAVAARRDEAYRDSCSAERTSRFKVHGLIDLIA